MNRTTGILHAHNLTAGVARNPNIQENNPHA